MVGAIALPGVTVASVAPGPEALAAPVDRVREVTVAPVPAASAALADRVRVATADPALKVGPVVAPPESRGIPRVGPVVMARAVALVVRISAPNRSSRLN